MLWDESGLGVARGGACIGVLIPTAASLTACMPPARPLPPPGNNKRWCSPAWRLSPHPCLIVELSVAPNGRPLPVPHSRCAVRDMPLRRCWEEG